MDVFESFFSAANNLNEQLGRELFDVLPEDGPIIVIINRDGDCWPSDSERFSGLGINEEFFQKLCDKIDDGQEPIVTKKKDCAIIGTQFATEQTNCGYAFVVLPECTAESALINIRLIEIVLAQIGLIGKLIEKNDRLYELQMKQFDDYHSCDSAIN